jgi:hypothetical protein
MQRNNRTSVRESSSSNTQNQFVFGKENYKWMLIGLAIIFTGYVLMIGGGSEDPNQFSDALFNTQRLTAAPVCILLGFVVEIFAIFRKPKDE